MFRQNNLYLASLPRISANSNENYRRYNFQALVNIFRNIKFLEIPEWSLTHASNALVNWCQCAGCLFSCMMQLHLIYLLHLTTFSYWINLSWCCLLQSLLSWTLLFMLVCVVDVFLWRWRKWDKHLWLNAACQIFCHCIWYVFKLTPVNTLGFVTVVNML